MSEQRRTFEEQTAFAIKQLYKLVGIALAAVFIGLGLTIWGFTKSSGATSNAKTAAVAARMVAQRLRADEQQTCKIQARGLPAGHQLAASMQQIYSLLTLPPSPDAPPPPRNVARLLKSLDTHLAAYLAAEGKQPATRSCS